MFCWDLESQVYAKFQAWASSWLLDQKNNEVPRCFRYWMFSSNFPFGNNDHIRSQLFSRPATELFVRTPTSCTTIGQPEPFSAAWKVGFCAGFWVYLAAQSWPKKPGFQGNLQTLPEPDHILHTVVDLDFTKLDSDSQFLEGTPLCLGCLSPEAHVLPQQREGRDTGITTEPWRRAEIAEIEKTADSVFPQ